MTALLEVVGLTAHYGDFQALFGVDLSLEAGETVAIIGANGAGKSTLMRAITGVARVTGGCVRLCGEAIDTLGAPDILVRGIAMVPEGRCLFPSLTVEKISGSAPMPARAAAIGGWSASTTSFRSCARPERPGTALSGGQQQMVAIAGR